MSEIQYGRLWSFSKRNLKIKLVRTIRKFIDPIKKTVKNVFIFLHRKLSEAKDYILDKLTVLGDYAEDKLAVRLNE